MPPVPQWLGGTAESPRLKEAVAWLGAKFLKALGGDRRIILFGDFDVDGTSSAAIMFLFSKLFNLGEVAPLISKRKDGYGLTKKSISRIEAETTDPSETLVILMDMGVSSTEETKILLEKGYEVMVIDHHVPSRTARAEWDELYLKFGREKLHVYDPLLFDKEEDLAFGVLSAAGLVYEICFRMLEENVSGLLDVFVKAEPDRFLVKLGEGRQTGDAIINTCQKICSIAQAADCMPFARAGELTHAWKLGQDFENQGPLLGGMKVLFELTNTASRIAWVIGPILNAAGRLEDAYAAFELLTEVNEQTARKMLENMQEVRARVRLMTQNAAINLESDICSEPGHGVAILLADPERVAPGVVGIAAARATETFGTPALYLSPVIDDQHGPILKGSMRRGETSFSCEKWILDLKDKKLLLAGGGHPAAAGLALKDENFEALLKAASSEEFTRIVAPVFHLSTKEAMTYMDMVTKTLPFGNGHASANMLIVGFITRVRGLVTSKKPGEPRIWAYALHVTDPESNHTTELKVMASDLSEELIKALDLLAGSPCQAPVALRCVVHDNYKIGSRYPRVELRVDAVTPGSGEPPPESGRLAQMRFISKDDLSSALGGDYSFLAGSGDATSALSVQDAKDEGDAREVLHIDWDERVHRRVFMLNREPNWVLTARLGEDGLKELQDLHGGRFDHILKCYIITWGVIERLKAIPVNHPKWKITFSPSALSHFKKLEEEDEAVAERKLDTRAFDVPFLRPDSGRTPFGFQYADVRLYLQRQLALSNNDMGTGKTIEAAVYGTLRHLGVVLDKDRMPFIPEGAVRRPVLFVTLKGVQGQYAKELEGVIDLGVSQFSTTEISAFLQEIEPDALKQGVVSKKAKALKLKAARDPNFRRDSSRPPDAGGEEDGGEPKAKSKKGFFTMVRKVSDETLRIFRERFLLDKAFIVTTYNCLERNPWIVSLLHWNAVVLDECHELKNPGAHKTRAIFGEKINGAPLRDAPVLAMTGTILKNRPSDYFVWVRMTAADGHCYTGSSVSNAKFLFDTRFDGLVLTTETGFMGRTYKKSENRPPENGDELKKILAAFMIRRLKSEIDEIPNIDVKIHRVPSCGVYMGVIGMLSGFDSLTSENRKILEHHKLIKGKDILDEGAPVELGEDDEKVGGLAGKLSMISSLDKAAGITTTLKELGWLTPNENGELEPFVVISMHQTATREIAAQLEKAGIGHFLMMQQDSAKKREEKKSAFMKGEKTAFVTTYGVGGTGLNLTRASRILLAGLPWTETSLAQARDRVHRIGQKKPVECVILILSAAIDEPTWGLIMTKGRANFATLNIDRIQKGQLPTWATGSLVETARDKSGQSPRRAGAKRQKSDEFVQAIVSDPSAASGWGM